MFDLALSPDDKTIASVIYQTFDVQLWDVPSRRLVRNLTGHTKSRLCVAFSPDGKLLATGGGDPNGARLGPAEASADRRVDQ